MRAASLASSCLSGAFVAALAAAASTTAGCTRAPITVDREVFVNVPRQCQLAQSRSFAVFYPSGDFEPSTDTPAASSLYLKDVGAVMNELPAATRSLVVDVSDPNVSLDWRGVADVPASGPINVLVWHGGEACMLTRNVEPRSDMTLASFGRHIIVAGGKLLDGTQVPDTFVGDLSTGILEKLDFGLGSRRSRPTVTAFRTSADQEPSPALVAGGADPDSGEPIATAEIYDPKPGAPGDLGDFEDTRIQLSEPRSKHGATVLSTGETLLVGGIGSAATPLRTMEIIDPKTHRNRTNGVALLAVARANPTVLRLASGEVFVAGGTDAQGNAVPTLEWFSADATHATKRTVDLVTGEEHGFVPLEAGGVLAVIKSRAPAPSDFKSVWVISADGTLEAGVPIPSNELAIVRLFEGAQGAPILWDGTRWLRWSPWLGAFGGIPDAPATGPAGDAIINGDSGLALWLVDDGASNMNVFGWRFDTRSRFSAVPKPLLVDTPDNLAPDRLAGVPGSSIRFVQGRGLELGPGASAFLTDVTFADFTADLDVVDQAAAAVVLRQDDGRELSVGGVECALTQTATTSISVTRDGKRVSVTVDGKPAIDCPTQLTEGARVSIGLRGAQGTGDSVATNLRVTRR